MKRLAKCTRCSELYRALLDGSDSGVCQVCLDLEQARLKEQARAAARRRDLHTGIAAGLLLAGAAAIYARHRIGVPPESPSSLTIQTDPALAEVFLDGEPIGRSADSGLLALPRKADDYNPHLLEVQHDGYTSYRMQIVLLPQPLPMQIVMSRAAIDVEIGSNPEGAAVWIDGTPRGHTPLVTQVSVDELTAWPIRLVKDGYEIVERRVSNPSDPNGAFTWSADLTPLPPRLAISSNPPGASVWINGRPQAVTPTEIELRSEDRGRTITVEARHPGYAPLQSEVSVPQNPGPRLRSEFAFSVASPRLSIETDPPGGLLRLNGRPIGTAPQEVVLTGDEPLSPIRLEASIEPICFGSTAVNPPFAEGNQAVLVSMDRRVRRVVFGIGPLSGGKNELWALTDQLKSEIEGLDSNQEFQILASDGIEIRAFSERVATASSAQKIRAFDFIDRVPLIESGGDTDPSRLPAALAALDPDYVWLCARELPTEAQWIDAFGATAATSPTFIRIAVPQEVAAAEWLTEWMRDRHGAIEPFTEMLAAGHSEE